MPEWASAVLESDTVLWVAIAVAAMLIFRAPVSRLIDRARKISHKGIETGDPQQQKPGELRPSGAEEIQRFFDSKLLLEREAKLRSELDSLSFRDPAERDKYVIKLLAGSGVAVHFERTYSLIFGSQLGVLQFLNTLHGEGVELAVVRPWYDQAAAAEPTFYASYSFEQWLSFLTTSRFIEVIGTQVRITLEGREFLQYLMQQGRSLYRRG